MKKEDTVLFRQMLKQVSKGRKLIKSIILQENIDMNMDFIILMPTRDPLCNYYTLLYLNMLTKQIEDSKTKLERINIPVIRKNEKFIIVTTDERVVSVANEVFNRTTKVLLISTEDMESILRRYTFSEFAKNHFIVASLDSPNGRQCRGLLNANVASIDELVAVGILGIRYENFKRWDKPIVPKRIQKDMGIEREK